MTDLMKTLYTYIQEHLDIWLCQDPEYRQFAASAGAREEKLRARLDPEGVNLLNVMLDERLSQHAVEQEAIFMATLSLCRELGRLGVQV